MREVTIRRVSVDEAKELIAREGFIYLDVRDQDEFEEGHAEGAFNVPFLFHATGENPNFVRVCERAFGREAKLVVGCKSGVRSLKAATALAESGFTHIADLRAGFSGRKSPFGETLEPGWSATEPIEQSAPDERRYASLETM